MPIIQFAVALVVLGILYARMIRRETPAPVSRAQAALPVVLGGVSVFLSFALFLALGNLMLSLGYSVRAFPLPVRPFLSAFFAAGLPEELAKLLMILLTLLIFRSKVRNVYEYILIGAAVGFGFALLEEFVYAADSGLIALTRLLTVAAHMLFGIVMGRHLGLTRYRRAGGRGGAGQVLLAICVPVLVHTLYDALTVNNYLMASEDEATAGIGMALSLGAMIVMFIAQFVVLGRLKKKAQAYCEMTF